MRQFDTIELLWHLLIMKPQKNYLSVTELAKHLDVHRNTVIRSIKDGEIQALKVGSKKKGIYRIPYTELERLLRHIPI